jgi:hypothetical protein
MKLGKVLPVLAASIMVLSVGLMAGAVPASAGRGSDVARLDMVTDHETPPGFENAGGVVKYNKTGSTIKFTLKASGLGPDEDYLVLFCGVIVGGGTSDKNGNLDTWGSGNESWYLESDPSQYFELYRVDMSVAAYPQLEDFERILVSPPAGFIRTR